MSNELNLLKTQAKIELDKLEAQATAKGDDSISTKA